MAPEAKASIVGAVELKDAHTNLPKWETSGEYCDHSAILVAPGWSIVRKGGGCFMKNKGFAVALVQPPQPQAVQNCPNLCVVMGHFPHPGDGSRWKREKRNDIQNVCGEQMFKNCLIAMGDWNQAEEDVAKTWEKFVGGKPTLVEPRKTKTCCFPHATLRYDYTATNIVGASSAGSSKVFPFQLIDKGKNVDEHHAVSVPLRLPLADSESSGADVGRHHKSSDSENSDHTKSHHTQSHNTNSHHTHTHHTKSHHTTSHRTNSHHTNSHHTHSHHTQSHTNLHHTNSHHGL